MLADSWAVTDGSPVPLSGAGGPLDLRAQVVDGDAPPLVLASDLVRLAPDATVSRLWLRLADVDDQTAVVDAVTDTVGTATPGAQVTGVVSLREQMDQVLDVLLRVVTGLLGGRGDRADRRGNTLALAVVERRQENGLLRALGRAVRTSPVAAIAS
ncbi:hypothetical protein ACI782_03255 [Geodermatophilus sp. SYSU D00703]